MERDNNILRKLYKDELISQDFYTKALEFANNKKRKLELSMIVKDDMAMDLQTELDKMWYEKLEEEEKEQEEEESEDESGKEVRKSQMRTLQRQKRIPPRKKIQKRSLVRTLHPMRILHQNQKTHQIKKKTQRMNIRELTRSSGTYGSSSQRL